MCLSYVYTSNKIIKCFFFSVVVKVGSLEKHYQGGFRGYVEKHYPLSNQNISVRVLMNGDDCYDLIADLIENGLKRSEDFVWFDSNDLFDLMCCYPDEWAWRKNLNLGVGWLKGRLLANGIGDFYVWYNDNYKEDA